MKIFAALPLLLALPSALVAAVPHPEVTRLCFQSSLICSIFNCHRRAACGNVTVAGYSVKRLYHNTGKDHFYTINIWDEILWAISYGYTVQTEHTARWFRYPTDATSIVPLYRLYQNATQTHLLTASASLRQTLLTSAQPPFADDIFSDGTPNGIAGYVYTDGSCPGTVPLLWASNSLITDNYYTIDTAEYNSFVANGYTPKGTVAWVYPPAPT